jgi:hypothetical protein
VVSTLCVLHNNILVNIRELDIEVKYNEEDDVNEDGEDLGEGYRIARTEQTRANSKRNEIAEAMWADYITRRESRDQRDQRE